MKRLKTLEKHLSYQPIQLFSEQNCSFRKITYQYRTVALDFMARQHSENEPLIRTIYKNIPGGKTQAYENQFKYWGSCFDQCIEDGLGIIIFDTQNNDEVIGVGLARNYSYKHSEKDNQKGEKEIGQLIQDIVIGNIKRQIKPQFRAILSQQNKIIQFWGGSIKSSHSDKGLVKKMFEIMFSRIYKFNYQFIYSFATNCKSAKLLKRYQFTKLGDTDCRNIQFEGKFPLADIQEENARPSLWIKKIK